MKTRKPIKAMYTKSGSGGISSRVAVNKTLLEKIGVTENEPFVEVEQKGNRIIITKYREQQQEQEQEK